MTPIRTLLLLALLAGTAAHADNGGKADSGKQSAEDHQETTTAAAVRSDNDDAESHDDATAWDETDRDSSNDMAKDWSPVPFSASYRVRYQGVPFTATGTRTLTEQEDGSWHFEAKVRAFMIRLEETSTFRQLETGALQSTHYTYDRSGIAGSRERDVTFDWDAQRIHRHDRGDEHDFGELIYDPVSWQIAMQRELMLGEVAAGDRFEYPVSNGSEPDLYLFEVIGEEEVDVPAGSFRTLKLERLHEDDDDQTRVWVAIEHDYLLVKLEHDDGRLLTLTLEDY